MHVRAIQRSSSSLLVFALTACTSDLTAPDLYQVQDDSADTTPVDDLDVQCGELPRAAVDASFLFSPQAMGGDGNYRFSAEDLPPGLAISESSGQIAGVPLEEGEHTFDLVVTDGAGSVGQDTCSLSIRPGLSVNLALDAVPHCAQRGESLLDFVVEGTGDGTPIRCEHPGGQGNGKRPDGISINEESCAIEGTVNEVRLGTWAFMVRGVQSGAEVWLPYCVTREDGLAYDIRVEHTTAGTDNTLVPLMRTYDPAAALDVGGDGDPRFEITQPAACSGASCFYGYAFSINSSPFSIDTIAFSPRGLLEDPGSSEPIGFFHEFSIGGEPVSEDFRQRSWVVNFDLDYCLSADPDDCTCPDGDATCDSAQRVRDNGDGNLEFSIIMVPE
jgi:hypothetical protein